MTTNIVVEDLTDKQNEIMYDLMNPEYHVFEGIFDNTLDTVKGAAVMMKDGDYKLEEVNEALGFLGETDEDVYRSWSGEMNANQQFVEDNEERLKALNELYKSGLSLAKIKAAIKEWAKHALVSLGAREEISIFEEFIEKKRKKLKSVERRHWNVPHYMVKQACSLSVPCDHPQRVILEILDKIEKCMNYHLKWGYAMDSLKKFEAMIKIQSRHRGNIERSKDYTPHWKKKNKSKIEESLLEEMIDEDMTNERKEEVREEIRTFLVDKGFASSKKTKKKKKKQSKKKKSKKKN